MKRVCLTLAIIFLVFFFCTNKIRQEAEKDLFKKLRTTVVETTTVLSEEDIELNAIASKKIDDTLAEFNRTGIDKYVYPDYLGGMYIDDDNTVVYQIVKRNIPKKKSTKYKLYKSIMDDKDSKKEYVNNSKSELEYVMDAKDVFTQNVEVYYWYIDEKENIVKYVISKDTKDLESIINKKYIGLVKCEYGEPNSSYEE